jgi:siroheme synthase
VLYASDVAESIVDLSRRDAQRDAYGVALDRAMPVLLPRMAASVRAGQRVCVLARGDAFRDTLGRTFVARVGELGLPCQVVPGVAERAAVETA